MKSLPLMLSTFRRKPIRVALTMLGVVVAFLLFGLLQGIDTAFEQALKQQRLDRLFVESRFSQPLPLAYRESIQRVPGLAIATIAAFMPGYYQDQKNRMLVIATEPALWLRSRHEYTIPQEQVDAISRTRDGLIISDWLARKYGLKPGDRITVKGRAPKAVGTTDWSFQVVGIMTYPDPTAQIGVVLANYAYYDEARTTNRGSVNRYILQVEDPRQSARIAREIDAQFATSNIPTRTMSEHEQGEAQLATLNDFRFFARTIIVAVFFALLMMTCNTMMESVRERTSELAVLKAIGFTDSRIFGLVLLESILPCVAAALIGLVLATLIFPLAGKQMDIGSLVATMVLPPAVLVSGVVVSVAVACVSAGVPAWKASRLSVVEAFTVR